MIERQASAFKIEFYERAKREQIREDLISYLGEYRFEVPEFSYELGIKEGKLTDPTTGEFMTEKAKKAIVDRNKDGLNTTREFAELSGLHSLESQLKENGLVVWFSPPGPKEEGYGDYGFGYVGRVEGDRLKMSAIRLESPNFQDFNRAAQALVNKKFDTAEEFLASPMVIDIDKEEVKQFIHGNFNIKNEQHGKIFKKSLISMENVLNDAIDILQSGTEEQKHTVMHVIENLSLEVKQNYERQLSNGENIDFIPQNLHQLLKSTRYVIPPPRVQGSCGSTSSPQSNDIFRNLNYKKQDGKIRKYEFNEPGPCRLCGRDVNCGPCKICEPCNNKIDANELAA